MKTHYIIYPAMVAMLSTSCGNGNVSEVSIEAQNKMSGELHDKDTVMVKRDGTLMSGALDQADSISLPSPVINAIENDPNLSISNIISTQRKTENSMTVFELKFQLADETTENVDFYENGNVKQVN